MGFRVTVALRFRVEGSEGFKALGVGLGFAVGFRAKYLVLAVWIPTVRTSSRQCHRHPQP